MNTLRLTVAAVVAAAATLGAASYAQAQTYHMLSTPEKGFWMEASYSDLEGLDQSFPSAHWFASGRIPLGSGLRITADIPFAYSRMQVDGGLRESSTVFGNPFVGLEYTMPGLIFESGVRVPLNSIEEDTFADVIGFLGDFQRAEAFTDEVVPVSGAVAYEYGLPGGASLRGRAGLVGLFFTDDEDTANDALVDYGLLGTYPLGPARFGLGVYGRWIATEDEGRFSDNSIHHLALSADVHVRQVRPGISVRVPVDATYNDVLNSTVSVYLQVPLN